MTNKIFDFNFIVVDARAPSRIGSTCAFVLNFYFRLITPTPAPMIPISTLFILLDRIAFEKKKKTNVVGLTETIRVLESQLTYKCINPFAVLIICCVDWPIPEQFINV